MNGVTGSPYSKAVSENLGFINFDAILREGKLPSNKTRDASLYPDIHSILPRTFGECLR